MPIKEENLILSLINSETGEELYQVDGLQNIVIRYKMNSCLIGEITKP